MTASQRDIFGLTDRLRDLEQARASGAYPFFRAFDRSDGPEARIDGRTVLMFGSNNYLGLTAHPKVREAAADAVREYGTSTTGSRFVNGSLVLHEALEEKLATFYGREAAIVFTTGYQVNLAVGSALLAAEGSVAVIDRRVHASLYDAVRLGMAGGGRMVRFRHNTAASLERALSRIPENESPLVMTDGVFSSEGSVARLDELVPVAKKHGARILVDDAHGLGVLGRQGRGTADHFGLGDEVDLIGGTFSKSLASLGGFLIGDFEVLDYLRHAAPSFMFAASGPPACVAAASAALDVMVEEDWRIARLTENYTYMRTELEAMGFEIGDTGSAVVPIYVRDDERTHRFWRLLFEEHGIYTNPFVTPGVPPKGALLRTSYMSTHERDHLDRGLEAFRAAGRALGLI